MRRLVYFVSIAALVAGCNSLLDFSSYKVGVVAETPTSEAGAEGGVNEAGGTHECTLNADCTSKGDFTICRKTDFTCQKLLAPDCPVVLGDWKNDNAVILGSILPIVGPDKAGGIPQIDAVAVALDDFKTGSNGLPPSVGTTARRPIAVVSCSEEAEDPNDVDAPTRSAKHLIDDVKVPAIIGASFSGDTQTVAQLTIPAGVLLMSPSATSVALTDIADNGLVWRTSPSDVIQASALEALMPQIEAFTRTRLNITPATKNLRVLILNKGDSYGKGLATALQAGLVFNGHPALDNSNAADFKVIDYGDPSAGAVDYDAVRQQVTAYSTSAQPPGPPDIVFLLGTNEVVPEFLQKLDDSHKPTYLFPDGGLVPELWTAIGANSELRKRVFGTVPGTNNSVFQLFKNHYASFIKDGTTADVGGTAPAYDALYIIAYAIAATSDKPVTGASINDGLKRVVPPGTISQPGSNNINTAFAALASGKNIDYDGASGPLDFDVAKGEAASDIQIWCIPANIADVAAPGINSGVFYNATTKSITNALTDPAVKTTCNF